MSDAIFALVLIGLLCLVFCLFGIALVSPNNIYTQSGVTAPAPEFAYRIVVDDIEYICIKHRTYRNNSLRLYDCTGYLGADIIVEDYTDLAIERITK